MADSPPAADRRLPVGADPLPTGGVHVRVWAPQRRRVTVVLEPGPAVELTPDALRGIEHTASEITVQGARYPEHLERMTGR